MKKGTLLINSSEIGERTEIKHLKYNQPFRYFGYTSRLDGYQTQQYIIHLDKAKKSLDK